MKLSVSLAPQDVDFLDDYARSHGLDSRSAAVQEAVRRLRAAALEPAYEDAWDEWAGSDDERAWDSVAADGLRR